MHSTLDLFAPLKAGALELKNRIVMAPMTRNRAANAALKPTELHAEYYVQRAGAGLIITEGTVVSPQGTGYVNVPGLYSDEQVEGWQLVTDAVHRAGGKIVVQLWHVGRLSHPDFNGGKKPVAPSAINPGTNVLTPKGKTQTVTPQALTKEGIQAVVADFARAAENAMKAGFDGVEIHSSNGYLFHQFFANSSNTRTDEYGGTPENKSRFLFEVLDCIAEKMPVDRIGLRLNPMLHGRIGIMVDEETAPTFDHIVDRLNQYNLAYLHVSRPPADLPDVPGFLPDVIGHYRKIYRGVLISNNNYDPATAHEEVAAGRADAIAFGRWFISNPDLPERTRNNWPLATPDRDTFYSSGEKGYLDYPVFRTSY